MKTMTNKQRRWRNIFVAVIALVAALTISNYFKSSNTVTFQTVVANESGHIELSASLLSRKATFYRYDHDGTMMEFFAVKDTQGGVHLALNRCDVCYDSGRGFFLQEGQEFVCQNCGNRYQTIRIGMERGGCNPSPITTSDFIKEDDRILISETFFSRHLYLFE